MFPIIFEIKYFTLHTFWLFFALGVFATIYTAIHLSVRNGLKVAFLAEHSGKLILFSIIAARIFSLIENYKVYFYEFSGSSFLRLFYIWDKGLNIWGALFGFILAFFLICRKKDQDFFKWLDVIVPSLIIGLAFGHLGTFFEGINYGKPSSLPWSVNFESPNIKYTVPIHPTQIYAFLYSVLTSILILLGSNWKKIKEINKSGILGLSGIIIYSFFSFLEEFIRGDDTLNIIGVRISQILSLALLIFAGIVLYFHYNNKRIFKNHKKHKPN